MGEQTNEISEEAGNSVKIDHVVFIVDPELDPTDMRTHAALGVMHAFASCLRLGLSVLTSDDVKTIDRFLTAIDAAVITSSGFLFDWSYSIEGTCLNVFAAEHPFVSFSGYTKQ